MQRRTVLRAGASVGATLGLAGCTGALGGNPNTELSKPDDYNENLPYPTWGDRMPDVSFRDPFADEQANLRSGGRPTFVTFFYTHCKTICPGLIGSLRNVQTAAVNGGYASEVQFLPVTFDPARDDAERLNAYADRMNVSLDAGDGDWRFLKPENAEAADEKINGNFAIGFEKTSQKKEGYMFNHAALVLLANADGYVERAYAGPNPDPSTLQSDLETVRG